MVKLTLEMIARKPSGQLKKKKEESYEKFINRLTHLNLDNRQLDEIGSELSRCTNLLALYLYDNQLTEIPDLRELKQLVSLYLQNNKISNIGNLSNLINLVKLYLGGNALCVIEGLENLNSLEELYVENQMLPPGESLIFDLQSIQAISKTLRILNVSGNILTSITAFKTCTELIHLNASSNKLENLDEVSEVISNWLAISKIDLYENPIACNKKYRDRIILASIDSLEILDGKEVTQTSKKFIKGMQESMNARQVLTSSDKCQLSTTNMKRENAAGDGLREYSPVAVCMSASIRSKNTNCNGCSIITEGNSTTFSKNGFKKDLSVTHDACQPTNLNKQNATNKIGLSLTSDKGNYKIHLMPRNASNKSKVYIPKTVVLKKMDIIPLAPPSSAMDLRDDL